MSAIEPPSTLMDRQTLKRMTHNQSTLTNDFRH